MSSFGKILIVIGILLIITGIVISTAGNIFSWFGRLPGDIRIERENFKFYAPITSMLLISFVLSVIINLIIKLFQKF